MEGALKKFVCSKHFMRSVSVQKECLKEQRQKPVSQKEYKNNHLTYYMKVFIKCCKSTKFLWTCPGFFEAV